MMRMLRHLARIGRRRPARSEELDNPVEEQDHAEEAPNVFHSAYPGQTGGGSESSDNREDFVAHAIHGQVAGKMMGGDVVEGVRWEVFHGARSLVVSALAGIVLVGADLVDPDGSNPGRVFGGVGAYLAMVLLIFILERRNHRRRQALLPADRFGGGRFALILAAIVLASVGGADGGNLGGWLAFSAVTLGGWSDGGWIAIAAERRGVGLWRAWRDLMAGEREARRQCWVALFGESR